MAIKYQNLQKQLIVLKASYANKKLKTFEQQTEKLEDNIAEKEELNKKVNEELNKAIEKRISALQSHTSGYGGSPPAQDMFSDWSVEGI